MTIDRDQFAHLLKTALTHLYDHAHLQLHPLAELLTPGSQQPADGMSLHRLLLEMIERLRPDSQAPPTDRSWRPYLALYHRYVEGMDVGQASEELAVSSRQFRREHATGLEALTDLLWHHYRKQQDQVGSGDPAGESDLLTSEIQRLGTAPASGNLTNVEAVMRGVLTTLQALFTQHEVTLAIDLSEKLPSTPVERVVLRQIFFNLFTHLLDRPGLSAIRITAQVMERQIRLIVAYEGPPADAGGTDDRLTIVGRLVTMQGGELQSFKGGAKRIRLTLPARRPPAVLIVDDNPDLIQLFRRYLSDEAYQVLGATTGQEALRLAREIRPQIIILDVMMPDRDGWEVLQHLKNHPTTEAIPVIVCSILKERELALALGATEALTKPVTREMLLAALDRCKPGPADAAHPGWPADSASSPPPKTPPAG